MSNKDLFKQAIAEAKTIREAAITNAKEALEESLTPHLKEMLAQKLQEMEDAEDMEEIVNEEDMINNPEGETAHGNVAEAEEEEEEAEEVEGEEAEEEGEEEGEEAEEEELDLENMSVEEFKDLVRDIVAQEIGHEESEEEISDEEAPEGAEDMVGMDSDEEEIDINELLAELEGMDNQTLNEDFKAEVKALAAKYGEAFDAMIDRVANAKPLFSDEPLVKASKKFNKFMSGDEEGYGLNKPSKGVGMKEGADDLNEDFKAEVKALAAKYGKAFDAMIDRVANAEPLFSDEPLVKASKKFNKFMSGDERGYGLNREGMEEELEEALETIEELRTQLQEVNLLNAKLLYVNKVFKANNLTESQKVNVVAAFDKAETVKEVKLVFETVSKNVVTKPVAIKEHKSFASSAAGTAATAGKKEIISEVSEQVARWQKLAGIIK